MIRLYILTYRDNVGVFNQLVDHDDGYPDDRDEG